MRWDSLYVAGLGKYLPPRVITTEQAVRLGYQSVRVAGEGETGPVMAGAAGRIGPHTTIGRDCQLRQTSIDNSILLNGAKVYQVRDIYGSIIGRFADLSASSGTGRNRLVVGDHTSLEVAG